MTFIKIDNSKLADLDYSSNKEIIQVNKQGSYSYSTIIDLNTRKYHALLAAPQPRIDQDQHVFLASIEEELAVDGQVYKLATHQYPNVYYPEGYKLIIEVTVNPLLKITYKIKDIVLTKERVLAQNENTILIKYTLEQADAKVNLRLDPFLAFRNKHWLSKANEQLSMKIEEIEQGKKIKLYDQYSFLFLQLSSSASFHQRQAWYYNVEYIGEKERGYDFREDLLVPGYFELDLKKGGSVVFSAGLTETNPQQLKRYFAREAKKQPELNSLEDCLQHAASQFIIGENKKAEIVAGYPWFGRWGRDTFISLPGLTLSGGDFTTFKAVIDTMIEDLKGPLFPNIGEGESSALNSVDAPLWFFWSLQQYAKETDSRLAIWNEYGDKIKGILEGYRAGTLFNIKMLENGLIYAGVEGKALTWMDAVYKGETFTPRIGMPVEINALWYNALCFSVSEADFAGELDFVDEWRPWIKKIQTAFIETFWNDEKGYLADFVRDDYKDWSIRPNQIFATSLPYSPLNDNQCKSILKVVKEELLTPLGLRTLSPRDEKYIGRYQGDQRNRDMAYHQGTVWPWLLGHFAEGYLKQYNEKAISLIKSIYMGFEDTVQEHGLGTVSEIYDGDYPHHSRGTISQAWSVSELLRINHMIFKYEKQDRYKAVNKNWRDSVLNYYP